MGLQEWADKQTGTWFVPSYHEADERVEGDVMTEENWEYVKAELICPRMRGYNRRFRG
jgi:hypothetical protein